jgi:hypothetical protein
VVIVSETAAEDGEYRTHILRTADGNVYTLGDEGFVSGE